MKNLQQVAAELAQEYGLNAPLMARYTDLVSEVGELGKELLLGSNYGNSELKITAGTATEIGDVLFSLVMIANSLNLDLDNCFDEAIEKYRQRFGKAGQIGS